MIYQFRKHLTLFATGGLIYVLIELLWRGYSHWTMFLLGGLCFVIIGLINEFLPWTTYLWKQQFIAMGIVTILEYITGCIVNLQLGWHVWDYTNLPLNIQGQVCLLFCVLWFFLAIPAILVDDYLRWKWYGECLPVYYLTKDSEPFNPWKPLQ